MTTWTQPICAARWNQDYAGKFNPAALIPLHWDLTGSGYDERCCYCNMPTRTGIYVRVNPATVPYPQDEHFEED